MSHSISSFLTRVLSLRRFNRSHQMLNPRLKQGLNGQGGLRYEGSLPL